MARGFAKKKVRITGFDCLIAQSRVKDGGGVLVQELLWWIGMSRIQLNVRIPIV